MKAYLLTMACVVVNMYLLSAQPYTAIWTGAENNNWNNSNNWSPAKVPNQWANVQLTAGAGPMLSGDVSISSITMDAGDTIDFNGHVLTLGNGGIGNFIRGATLNNSNPAIPITIEIYGGLYGTTWGANTVNGNLMLNIRKGDFLSGMRAGNGANTYNGNTTLTIYSGNAVSINNMGASIFNGDYNIITYTKCFLTSFQEGSFMHGNFNLTVNAGGNVVLGNLNTAATVISGMANIQINPDQPLNYCEINGLTNQSAGGTVSLNASNLFFRKNNLHTTIILVSDGANTDSIYNNSITGNVTIADGATNNNGNNKIHLRNNSFIGNTQITCSRNTAMYDYANEYNGNIHYLNTGAGSINIGGYEVTISGNMTISSSAGISIKALVFSGSAKSSITQSGTQPIVIADLKLKKNATANLVLEDSVQITNGLSFGGGNIVSASGKEVIFLNDASYSNATDTSHIVGPVIKTGDDAFTFPIGSQQALQAVSMTAPGSVSDRFMSEYFSTSPHPIYDTAAHESSMAMISGCEYWEVKKLSGTSNVGLSFDFGKPCGYVYTPAQLRVAYWTGSMWQNLGNGGYTGTGEHGTVSTTSAVTQYGIFTLASASVLTTTISISANVANPVNVCSKVTFLAISNITGNNPIYQWKKNGLNVGTNENSYIDSTLLNRDTITCELFSNAAFSIPQKAISNALPITTNSINSWLGAISTDWFTAANWSSNQVPCELTDVLVNSGTLFNLEIVSDQATCKSITAKNGSIITVKPNAKIQVKGN